MNVKINGDIDKFVKRFFYLAYQASQVFGLGFLQARPNVTETEVINNIATQGDYPGRLYRGGLDADYVFGRTMKLCVRSVGDDTISFNDEWRPDYQSFCTVYTPQSLLDQVAKETACSYTLV